VKLRGALPLATFAALLAACTSGSIQVTERTYRRLCGSYVLEERGVVDVKGKGEMRTWLFEGRLAGVPSSPQP